MSKRSERLQLHATPEALERWTSRANQLGLSVQLWIQVTLDRASSSQVGQAMPLDPELVERMLAVLND